MCKFAGLALLVLALARPQKGLEDFRIQAEGIAITMCIDRSGSMQALDFHVEGKRVDRLAAVKKVFRDFVAGTGKLAGRPNDMIGLIAFGGFADAKCPLTLDHNVLLEVLDSVEIPQPIYDSQSRMINRRILDEELATAIGDAVLLGIDRLKDSKAKSKVLILLSDGENNAGIVDPADAGDVARDRGVKIYTIGVGSTGMAPFPDTDVFGRRVLTSQHVVLDEDTLKMLAERTGGRYYNARNTQALTDIYSEIDKLEKTATEGRLYTRYRELYLWLLVPGLVLILLESALSTTWLRSLP
jgi:Ca-activated chloride channel family protein